MALPVVRPRTYRRITAAALAAQVAIVVTGAAVRLTGSGLGCTDWPGCFEDRFVPEWGFHHWVEYGNRLFSLVVLASVVAATLGGIRRRPRRGDLIVLSLVLVAGVVAQALVGAVLVIFELDPRLTITHFLLSMVLIAAAVVLHRRAGRDGGARRPVRRAGVNPSRGLEASTRWAGRAMAVAAAVVVVTGTVVTGTGPHGGDDRAARFDFPLDQVARIHATSMWVFVATVVALGLLLWRSGDAWRAGPLVGGLVGVTAAQATVGYTQYALGVPAGLVILHIVGACAVWTLAVATLARLEGRPVDPPTGPGQSVRSGPVEAAALPVLSRG